MCVTPDGAVPSHQAPGRCEWMRRPDIFAPDSQRRSRLEAQEHLLAAVRLLAALFLSVMLCRSRKRQSELRLVLIRRLRSSATVSTKVRSGRWAIRSKISTANSSNGETLPPRGFGAALLC